MIITLVQLGNPPKKYFWKNVERLKEMYGSQQVCVITDREDILKRSQQMKVLTHRYKISDEIANIFKNHEFPHEFRNGFWQFSAIRLFAILDFSVKSSQENVLHIESDILLMRNFPINEISKLSLPTWVNFNKDRDIASLVYLPTPGDSQWLRDQLVRLFSEDSQLTDMSALRSLSNLYPSKIAYFPSKFTSNEAVKTFSSQQDENFSLQFDRETERGLFDGAAIGMWLTGQDPNNYRGFLRRLVHLDDGPVDLRDSKFALRNGELFLLESKEDRPIYNLHVHSKNSFLFGRTQLLFLAFFIFLANRNIRVVIFQPFKFLMLAKSKIIKRFV